MNTNMHYIDLSGTNGRVSSHEAIQAIYCLTKVVDSSKITPTKSITFK